MCDYFASVFFSVFVAQQPHSLRLPSAVSDSLLNRREGRGESEGTSDLDSPTKHCTSDTEWENNRLVRLLHRCSHVPSLYASYMISGRAAVLLQGGLYLHISRKCLLYTHPVSYEMILIPLLLINLKELVVFLQVLCGFHS